MPKIKKKRAQSDNGLEKVTEKLSLSKPEMSLFDRAAAGVKAERSGARIGMLGQIDRAARPAELERRRGPPSAWTVVHVMDRMEEAFAVLARIPISTRPRSFGNSMPTYVYDRFDLNAQTESYELERTLRSVNRVRLPATPAEIARMEQAFGWIGEHLARYPEVARAVCLGAHLAKAPETFDNLCLDACQNPLWVRRRQVHGLTIIAMRLAMAKVPVS